MIIFIPWLQKIYPPVAGKSSDKGAGLQSEYFRLADQIKKLIFRADYYESDLPESHFRFGVAPLRWGLAGGVLNGGRGSLQKFCNHW